MILFFRFASTKYKAVARLLQNVVLFVPVILIAPLQHRAISVLTGFAHSSQNVELPARVITSAPTEITSVRNALDTTVINRSVVLVVAQTMIVILHLPVAMSAITINALPVHRKNAICLVRLILSAPVLLMDAFIVTGVFAYKIVLIHQHALVMQTAYIMLL